ncbi:MAG: ABC transporter ATP-binding protein [Caldisericia bacterium]|nr:ABC transporter ATP-binding protein [Caldisericia bacterium]
MKKKVIIKKLGVELDFTPPEPPKRHGFAENLKHLKRVLPYARPLLKHFILLSLFSVISAAFGLILPFAPKIILDNGVAKGDFGLIVNVLMFTFWANLFSMLVGWFNGIYSEYLSSYIAFKTQVDFYRKLSKLDEEYFDSQRSGDLISRSSGLANGISYISSSLNTVFTLVVRILAIPAAVAVMDWRVAAFGFPTLIFTTTAWYFIQRLLRSYQKARMDASGKLSSTQYDLVSSLSDLRMSGQTRRAMMSYIREYVSVWRMGVVSSLVSSGSGLIQSLVLAVVSLLINIFGWGQVTSGAWTLGKVSAITIAFGYITSPLQTMFSLWEGLVGTSISIQRFFEVYDAKELPKTGKEKIPDGPYTIECKQIVFSYAESKEILKGLDIQAKPGEIVAITGDSGAGKTTLLKIVAGLLNPKSGHVEINGTALEELDGQTWRGKIGFLSQHPYFGPGNLIENITFRRETKNDPMEMIKLCRLSVVAERLGDGPLGERARNISAGEKQRVALARVMLMDREILLLDEPLAQVDIPTAKEIFADISPILRKGTTIIITHNPVLIKMADKIYFIYDGKAFEGGQNV